MEKTFKTLDEQIKILQDKGMVIDDINYTKDVLLRENYFFIMGYRHLFFRSEHDRRFVTNTNFSEIYALFNFDRQVRNILFKNMLIVENNAKSIFSYQLSKQYGFKEKDYLKKVYKSKAELEEERQLQILANFYNQGEESTPEDYDKMVSDALDDFLRRG